MAAVFETVRAKVAADVANSAVGSAIRTAQTTQGSTLDGLRFLALLMLAYTPHNASDLEREQEKLLSSLAH